MQYAGDRTPLTNEDLIACYPRRLQIETGYELWQFPYVRDDVLYDEDDLIIVRFHEGTSRVSVLSKYPHHLEDRDYLGRVLLLVHDASQEFFLDKYLVERDGCPSEDDVREMLCR